MQIFHELRMEEHKEERMVPNVTKEIPSCSTRESRIRLEGARVVPLFVNHIRFTWSS